MTNEHPETPQGPTSDAHESARQPHDTASLESTDAADEQELRLAGQLDRHLELLESGQNLSGPEEPNPQFGLLSPVVDKLHWLSVLVDASVWPGATASLPETEDVSTPPKASRADQPEPERIGKYEVRRVLGRGGQASAYLAFDPDLRRHVVIKLYHAARSAGDQERVLKEGRALARVQSPFVGNCYGAERHEGVPYLVVEYVPGMTLAATLQQKQLGLDKALQLVSQVAEGLDAVHACGLIHRDIKPGNIILADDGKPRLVDFGLAVPVASEQLEEVSGTLAYMPPEQARGETERIDQRSDLFGLGAVLYQLLTGRPPYQAASRKELLERARRGDIERPAGSAKVPPAVAELCMRCLAKSPADRPSSAAELRRMIDRLRQRRPKRFLQAAASTAAAAGVLAAIVLLVASLNKNDPLDKKGGPKAADAGNDSAPHAPLGSAKTGETDGNREPVPGESSRRLATRLTNLPTTHPDGRQLVQVADFLDVHLEGGIQEEAGVVQLVEGQSIRIHVQVERDCYLRVFTVEYTGEVKETPDRMNMLFPNEAEPDNLVLAGRPRIVPGTPTVAGKRSQRIVAAPSQGPEFILVVATSSNWETGQGEAAGVYRSFPSYQAGRLQGRLRSLELQAADGQTQEEVFSEVLVPYHVRPKEKPTAAPNPEAGSRP